MEGAESKSDFRIDENDVVGWEIDDFPGPKRRRFAQ
jgi:hypothetical protein